ncbi:MAG TPA: hypothetical protein VFF70_01495 [Anaerolineae bacterium]|nr:hypothetical protein [Anaerolineae bacterium]
MLKLVKSFVVGWFAVVWLGITLSSSSASSAHPAAADRRPINPSELHRTATITTTIYFPIIAVNYIPPPTPVMVSLRLGLNFVSSAEAPANTTRYQQAADLNPAINRWPFYWYGIEPQPITQPRTFDWSKIDANVIADTQHNLPIDAILLGTPPDLATGGSALAPRPKIGDGLRVLEKSLSTNGPTTISSVASPPIGLYDGIYANGVITNDVPGKPINPNNRWAYFVNAAVNRYKPGGTIAQAQGWLSTTGITHWEIWNEEDLNFFFSGTITDYARLLKVAYLSAKSADPHAVIVLGGMAHFEKPTWLNDTLNIIATDPLSITYHGYMDAVASHSYAWSWQTFNYLYQDRSQLNARGLNNVRLWLTETGLPVCDDPPYVFCPSTYRGSMHEQANYLIQTLTFAQWLNAEMAIWFQMVDDCGNDGHYDAFGLIRNPASMPACPQTARDGTTRSSYDTYQVFANRVLGAVPYWRKRPTSNQELIAFKRASAGQRIVVMWARSNVAETVVLSATSSSAELISPDGSTQAIFSINGVYTITLPAATNYSTPTNDGSAAIGGDPRILIETDPDVTP